MVKSIVREFRNDDTLEAELNTFQSKWHKEQGGNIRIVSVTVHHPMMRTRSVIEPGLLKYTFFYTTPEEDV